MGDSSPRRQLGRGRGLGSSSVALCMWRSPMPSGHLRSGLDSTIIGRQAGQCPDIPHHPSEIQTQAESCHTVSSESPPFLSVCGHSGEEEVEQRPGLSQQPLWGRWVIFADEAIAGVDKLSLCATQIPIHERQDLVRRKSGLF